MASNKNPFLDDLFPDPMRARKARIFKGYERFQILPPSDFLLSVQKLKPKVLPISVPRLCFGSDKQT